jgi:hypothetical protein
MLAPLEGVRSQGWTSRDLRLAVARLSEIVADQTPKPDDGPCCLSGDDAGNESGDGFAGPNEPSNIRT